MIHQIISQRRVTEVNDISSFTDKIQAGVDTTTTSIYWFFPYKASDFPEVTCDKDYFFIWSTDHGVSGGVWWGKGNNLDLSDFEEIGQIVSGYSAETPRLYRFSGETRPIYLYYHTIQTNPINICGGQETNLITTTGGALDSATWTQETNPLGCQGSVGGISQSHTGYFNLYNLNGNLVGVSLFTGGIPQYYQRHYTEDGLTFTHENTVFQEYDVFIEGQNRKYLLMWGEYFSYAGKLWGLVNSVDNDDDFSIGDVPTGKIHLVKVNSNLEITQLVATLNNGNMTSGVSFFIDGDTAHLYMQTGREDYPDTFYEYVKYATFDLTQLATL